MNPLVLDRRIDTPPGYAERDCRLVSYRMPFCRHCFVLCHDPSGEHPSIDYTVMDFFMGETHALSRSITGNPHSFVAIHSGGFVRKRLEPVCRLCMPLVVSQRPAGCRASRRA